MTPGAIGRSRAAQLALRALFVLCSLFLSKHARAAPLKPKRVVTFTETRDGRIITWPEQGNAQVLRKVDPSGPVELGPRELLLVPVNPGDVLRVRGAGRLGLASGTRELPDVITWSEDGSSELRVPSFSSARFFVVAADAKHRELLGIDVARAESDAFGWYRQDERVHDLLRANRELDMPDAPVEVRRSLRYLDALSFTLRNVPSSQRSEWLLARWFERSLRVRPLAPPYFANVPVALSGGVPVASDSAPETAAIERRMLGKGAALRLDAASADVLRIQVQARGAGATKLAVFEGDVRTRVLEFRPENRDAASSRWLSPEIVRAVVPAGGAAVRVQVLEGAAVIAVEGFSTRTALLDAFARFRDRRRALEHVHAQARPSHSRWFEALARATITARRTSYQALRDVAATLQLQPELRAFIDLELFVHADGSGSEQPLLPRLLREIDALPARVRAIYLRSLFESLIDQRADELDARELGRRTARSLEHDFRDEGVNPDDAQALTAESALMLESDAAHSALAVALAERAALNEVADNEAVLRARRSWLRKTAWSPLSADPGTPLRTRYVVPREAPDTRALCAAWSDAGPRWTWLDRALTEIRVAPPFGTHAVALIRAPDDDPRESRVNVDGIPATVHGAAGLAAELAIAPGLHRFEIDAKRPLVARVAREERAPCRELRDVERWSALPGQAEFAVPPLIAASALRVVVDKERLASKAHRLTVEIAGRRTEAWVRYPASGAIEAALPRSAASVRVASGSELWVRASVRLPISTQVSARLVTEHPTQLAEDERGLLEELRTSTRHLRAAPSSRARSEVRLERARILHELGAARLAELERERAGQSLAVPSDVARSHELEVAVILPLHAAPVVPIGVAAQIPPLGSAADEAALARARKLDRAHEPPAAVVAELVNVARDSNGADALLLGNAAERTGLAELASRAYERIANATGSGAAFARAATLRADASLEQRDPDRALFAYLLARRAVDAGEPASDVLARLSEAISWTASAGAGSGAASALVEEQSSASEEPIATRIRRAWIDAPAAASLLSSGDRLELYVDGRGFTQLDFEIVCAALEGNEPCATPILQDGAPIVCDATRAPAGGDSSAPALPARCSVSVPTGRHRVEVLPPQGPALVSVSARAGAGASILEKRVVSSWSDLDAQRPLELSFAGPTVLHVRARARAGVPERLRFTFEKAGEPPNSTVWDVPSSADPRARLHSNAVGKSARAREQGAPDAVVGEAAERWFPIATPGPQTLRIEAEGRTLVRVEAAYASGLPRARTERADATVPALAPERALADAASPQPVISEAPDMGLLTLGASATYQEADLSELEGNRKDRNLQFSAYAYRELVKTRAWVASSLLYRARQGADSQGFTLGVWATSDGIIPGGYARTLVVRQAFPGGHASASFYGVAGVLWSIPAWRDMAIVPWTDVIGRRAGTAPSGAEGVDGDFYTRYAALHPVSWNSGIKAEHRPFADVLTSYGAALRYAPNSGALDRIDGVVTLDALPGGGITPWLEASVILSRRPEGPGRSMSFTRITSSGAATFWRWLLGSDRVLVAARATHFKDFPNGNAVITYGLSLTYERTFNRGLRDYPTRSTPFRGRLEEGNGRVLLAAPAREPLWEAEP